MRGPLDTLAGEIIPALKRRRTCSHEGETQEHCSRCGKDLRVVTSLECRLCALFNRPKMFPADAAPDFCPRCGAPAFTFKPIKKKQSRK